MKGVSKLKAGTVKRKLIRFEQEILDIDKFLDISNIIILFDMKL